MIFAQPKFIK